MTNKVFTLRRYSEENKAYREYEMQVNNITESEALQIYYEGRPNFGKTYMAKLSDVEKLEINLAYNCYYNEMVSKVSVDDLRNFKKVLRVKVLKSIITLTDNLTLEDFAFLFDETASDTKTLVPFGYLTLDTTLSYLEKSDLIVIDKNGCMKITEKGIKCINYFENQEGIKKNVARMRKSSYKKR